MASGRALAEAVSTAHPRPGVGISSNLCDNIGTSFIESVSENAMDNYTTHLQSDSFFGCIAAERSVKPNILSTSKRQFESKRSWAR